MRITEQETVVCLSCSTEWRIEGGKEEEVTCPRCSFALTSLTVILLRLNNTKLSIDRLTNDFRGFKASLSDLAYNQQTAIDQAREIDKKLIDMDVIDDYKDVE